METIKSSCLEKPPRRLTLLLVVSLGLASGCAQIPRLDPPPSIRKVDELGSSSSFAVPAATWPSDHWWEVYGDPQLNALIDEALKNAPDLDLAQARLKAAAAQVQGAGATRLPEVTASAVVAEAKQSYDFLVPRQALPNGWNGYGAATLNMSYELDFWGKNRAALAAAVSEQHAAEVEIAQTRLILSTSVASAYAGLLHLYTLRDNAADTLSLASRQSPCSANAASSASRRSRACGKSRHGRPPPREISLRSMSVSVCRATPLPRFGRWP